jgi:hypothetical protein
MDMVYGGEHAAPAANAPVPTETTDTPAAHVQRALEQLLQRDTEINSEVVLNKRRIPNR